MSIECNNTTPIASRFSDLTTPVGDGDIDFSALIAQPDPLDQVNRAQIVNITDKLNGLLSQEDISGYPTLSKRYKQFPLTYTEIADYVLSNAIDTVDVLNAIDKYDGALGTSAVVASTLDDLDTYYDDNLGKTINEGICGAFGDTLLELLAAFTLLDATVTKLNGINLNDLDPKKAAIALAQKLKIDALAKSLAKTIDKLIEKIKKKVGDAVKKAVDDITEFVGNPGQSILNQLTKMQNEISDFFSSDTVKRIQENVEKFIAEMVAMFERPTLANIQLMMHKLCNLTETIMHILFEPADEIAELAKVIDKEKKVLDATDAIEQKNAEDAGAIRVKKEVASEVMLTATEIINDGANDTNPNRYTVRVPDESRARSGFFKDEVRYRQPGELGYVDPATNSLTLPTNVDYVTSPHITPDETRAINAMNESGIGPNILIAFSFKVVDGKQWQNLHNTVLAKLLRISHLTGDKYVLRQGVVPMTRIERRREYGKLRKQGSDGYHSKHSGYSCILNITEANRDKTIIAASRAGFTGIGVGKNYLHLHVGNREGFVATQNDPRWKDSERFSDSDKVIYESMMRTHRQDGYRKKMSQDDEFRFFDKSTFKQEEKNDGTFSFVDNNSILGINSQEEQPFSLLRPTD